jgi:hypothetical protein
MEGRSSLFPWPVVSPLVVKPAAAAVRPTTLGVEQVFPAGARSLAQPWVPAQGSKQVPSALQRQ